MDLPEDYVDEADIIECNSQLDFPLFGGADGFKEFIERDIRSIPWICVEGYNTSLPTEEIKTLLTNHFSSCGRIIDVYIPNDNKRCAYIYIAGVDSALKAVELSGSEVGGRKIVACVSQLPRNETITDAGPYGYTFPGHRIVAEAKTFPLPEVTRYTFGSGTTDPADRINKAEKMTEE